MERDRRLAGPRSALDDQQAAQGGSDDLVLLALDGGDDVGHLAGARPVQSREQGRRAADGHVTDQELTRGGTVAGRGAVAAEAALRALHDPGRAEALVLDADHLTPVEGEVPTEDEALRVASGRPVEGLGDRRAPVDDQRLVVGVVDGDTSDMEDLGRGPVGTVGRAVPVGGRRQRARTFGRSVRR